MAKNKKNSKKNNYIKASDSKKQRAVEFFTRCTWLLFAVIVVSLLICFNRSYELEHASAHGPALWFLHLTAWPLLFLPGLINNISWVHNTAAMNYLINENPALLLAMLATLLLGVIYLILKRYGLTWFGTGGMRSAGHFMLIFACWGIFQLLLCAVIVLLDTNTLIPFHPLKSTPPAAVQQELPNSHE